MRSDFVHDETRGVRGLGVYRTFKAFLSRTIGRAWLYDHVTAAVEHAMQIHRRRGRPLVYYEFGTGSGNTLQRALYAMRGHPDASAVLFDSFEGLPEAVDHRDWNPFWKKGDFAFSQDYIRTVIRNCGFPLERARLVPGFFEASLTEAMQRELAAQPPSFVTVDVDYYSSTAAVLTFLRPLMASGTVVYFDDLGAFDGHPDYGQVKALREFNESNRVGQLVPHPVLGNRMFVYYRHEYEHAQPRTTSTV